MSKPFEEMKNINKATLWGEIQPKQGFPAFSEKFCTWVQYRRITSGGGCAMKECRR